MMFIFKFVIFILTISSVTSYVTFVKPVYIGFRVPAGGSDSLVPQPITQDEYSFDLNVFDSIALTEGQFQVKDGSMYRSVQGVLIQFFTFDKSSGLFTETANVVTQNMLHKQLIQNKIGSQR